MDYKLDVKQTLGKKFYFAGTVYDWEKYAKKGEILGAKVEIILLDKSYEKIFVKLADVDKDEVKEALRNKKGALVDFDDLEAKIWFFKDKKGLDVRAKDMIILSLDEESES